MLKKVLLIMAALCCFLYMMAGCRFAEVVGRPGIDSPAPTPWVSPSTEASASPGVSPELTETPQLSPITDATPLSTPSPELSPTPQPTAGPVQVDTLPIYSVEREEKVVALSFDASWGATYTEELLDILDEYGARATFFLVGFWVDEHPDLVIEIEDRDHAIGNHSENHLRMNELTDDEVADELNTCQDKIDDLTGRPDTLVFRPPYGAYDDEMLKVCAGEGYYSIQWDVDSWDWKGISALEIEERVLSRVEPGSIVLMHNEGEHTAQALPGILAELSKQGYSFVTIPELIYKDNYRIDRTGRQMPIS